MDHRAAVRSRAFLKARIVFNNGMSTLDCLIRDVSDTGARLQISDSVAIPNRFDLYIPKKDETRRANLQWRTHDEIGVAFEDATAAPKGESDLAHRVAQLETETAALRQLVEEMGRQIRAAGADGLQEAG